MIRKVVKILWIFIALISLVCVFIFFSIAKGWIGYMPPVEDLENPNYKFATEVFSEDGKVLGTYSYSKENRVFVGYNDLSPNIINALIATEDVRFAEHSGIDAYALTRAVVKRGILMQKNAGGGSTITQQLSKQLYSPSADNVMERLFQKPIEWVIAVKLERYYTKEEILTMYLNKFDFLNNAFTEENNGVPVSSYAFFHIALPEYNQAASSESAILYGIRKEKACAPQLNSGLFAAMKEMGDVRGVFVGHDHDDDYAVSWKGILLAYGRYTGGNTVYNHLTNGARVIELDENANSFRTWIRLKEGAK